MFVPDQEVAADNVEDPAEAQVASPLQNVEEDAEVPELRLATGRLPVTPVVRGNPVALVRTPEAGVPRAGVTNVGEVAKTNEPEPVSFVTAVARLAEVGVAKNVATPVPKPDIPVETGRPVALVRVPEAGVPNTGVTNVGEVDLTKLPVPVTGSTVQTVPEDETTTSPLSPSVTVVTFKEPPTKSSKS